MFGHNPLNLAMTVDDVVINNYHIAMVSTLGKALDHMELNKFQKSIFCQISRIPGEVNFTRVGLIFVTYDKEGATLEDKNKQYRLVWCRFEQPELANIFATHLCQALALALSNTTDFPWNAVACEPGVISVAPSKIIELLNKRSKDK